MNQQVFRSKMVQVLGSLLLGSFLLSAAPAWCAGNEIPQPGNSKTAVAAVKEVKGDKTLPPQAKAGKVQHSLTLLSNQELLALLQETRMEMPAYQHLTRIRPAAKANVSPGANGMPADPVGKAQVQQALETALTQPDSRQFIVSMLSNYLLNNPAY